MMKKTDGKKRWKTGWKMIPVVLILLVAAVGIAFYLYTRSYYHAVKQDYAATEENEDFLIYGGRDSACGFIFYPGGKVEECAYAPILSMLADKGVCCVVPKMPYHLAVLRPDAASRVMEEIPDVKNWYIGGHSLGGAMAADFAAENRQKFSGLVLLAAYPTKEIKMLPVLSIYGSEDGVLNQKKYKESITYADALTEYVIEGGNHAGFGNYGEQKGDGSATITKEEQWQETVNYILNFLKETGGVAEEVSSEIFIDFPFSGETRDYSLVLVTKGEPDGESNGDSELRLYDETGEILQQISCGVLAEPIRFSYDGLCGWSDLEIFPAHSSTGLCFGWADGRFSENAIEIPKYTEVRGSSMFTAVEENTYQEKKIWKVNKRQECVEEIRGWQLQKDTGALEIWNYSDDQILFKGIVTLNEEGIPENEEYFDMLFWDGIYSRWDYPEETAVPVWIDEPRTESTKESEGIERFENIQKIVFGNDGHTGECESREVLLEDYGFEDSTPMYQYYDLYHNLRLELYMDETSEQFCGIAYEYYIDDEKGKWAKMYGFTVNTVLEQEWAGADAFSMKTVYGDEGTDYTKDYEEIIEYTSNGLPDYFCYQGVVEARGENGETPKELSTVVEIDYIYRDDGTLFYRQYWHDPMEFGTTLCSLNSFYDERGRVVYENGYITHGKLEYYYIYENEEEKPAYCLILDHNVGYTIPNIIRYY